VENARPRTRAFFIGEGRTGSAGSAVRQLLGTALLETIERALANRVAMLREPRVVRRSNGERVDHVSQAT